jgi:peroxidase
MQAGGLGYDVPAGRRDGKISLASDTRTELPPPTFNVNQLTPLFARTGLTQEEMVTLSGMSFKIINIQILS